MIGVFLPGNRADKYVESIKQAEAKGVPAFWVTTGGLLPDMPAVFAAASMVTSKIKFGTSVTETWPRHPVALVSQAIALSQLAPGRFRIGLGPSHKTTVEDMYGIVYEKPLRNLREHLFVITELMRKGEVDFSGEFVKSKTKLGVGPTASPVTIPIDVPVMISALQLGSFRLAGEMADGAISWVSPWKYLRDDALPAMRQAAEAANRPAPPLVTHITVALSNDKEVVREAARAQFGRYTTMPNYQKMFGLAGFADPAGADNNRLIDTLTHMGDEAEVAERLATVMHEGSGEIIVHPIYLTDDRDAENEATLDLVARANKDAGIKGLNELLLSVEAVCLSVPGERIAKRPVAEAFLGPHGFVGDRHEAEFLRLRSGKVIPNNRQWTAVSTEEVAAVCADLGCAPFAIGDLGENLRFAGLMLARVPEDTVIEFPSGARMRVAGQNVPCNNAARTLAATYGAQVEAAYVRASYGRRGLIGSVLEVGIIRPGDVARLVLP